MGVKKKRGQQDTNPSIPAQAQQDITRFLSGSSTSGQIQPSPDLANTSPPSMDCLLMSGDTEPEVLCVEKGRGEEEKPRGDIVDPVAELRSVSPPVLQRQDGAAEEAREKRERGDNSVCTEINTQITDRKMPGGQSLMRETAITSPHTPHCDPKANDMQKTTYAVPSARTAQGDPQTRPYPCHTSPDQCLQQHRSCSAPPPTDNTITPRINPLMIDLRELNARIQAIPTREDMEQYVTRLENSYRSELSSLRDDVQQIGERVTAMETSSSTIADKIEVQNTELASQSFQIQYLADLLDDAENRGRRNNIRIRGLPETIESKELDKELRHLFNAIVNAPLDSRIELDRAHRALGPKSADPDHPRDVICRVHRYQQKDAIMAKARAMGTIQHQGKTVQILPDLSRWTLQKRKALKPLLEILRARNIPYTWGFPFRLRVRTAGRVHILSHPSGIPAFTAALHIPSVTISEWPSLPATLHQDEPHLPPPQRQRNDRARMRIRREDHQFPNPID